MGRRKRDEHEIQYVHSPPGSQDWGFLGCFSLPFLFCALTDYIFEQCSLLCFIHTHFYHWTFLFLLLLCGAAVFAYARAFNGDLSTWDVGGVTNMVSST